MQGTSIIDIHDLSASQLDPLLSDEMVDWREELDWDFSKSAELVRKLAEDRMLNGAALLDHGEVPGLRRIESQLMLVNEASAKTLQREAVVIVFERLPMKLA